MKKHFISKAQESGCESHAVGAWAMGVGLCAGSTPQGVPTMLEVGKIYSVEYSEVPDGVHLDAQPCTVSLTRSEAADISRLLIGLRKIADRHGGNTVLTDEYNEMIDRYSKGLSS